MSETLIICPKCGHLAYWDSYFQKYVCTNEGDCGWMGDKSKDKPNIHSKCDIEFERNVNEVLWWAIMERGYNTEGHEAFENETFLVRPYCWQDELPETNDYLYYHNNEYHFWHKPSGFRLCWYKYPLRSPMVNMEITHEQFWDILHDCMNSVHPKSTYEINEWWRD